MGDAQDRYDPSREVAPELAAFRADSRYPPLLSQPSDFADPFVEPVKIIREWDGESAHDQFGWIARKIGDVDGDGVPDFVTSAPTKNIGGADAGRVYAYSTKSGEASFGSATMDIRVTSLGSGIEAYAGDNHDGIPDVVASAPGVGKVYVYSGKDGKPLLTMTGENWRMTISATTWRARAMSRSIGAPGIRQGPRRRVRLFRARRKALTQTSG